MDFEALRAQLANPDTQDRLAGIGQALGGLARGQVADLSGVRQGIADRQAHSEILGNSDLLAKFTPEQRAMLASLPPQAAQQIIADTVFAPAAEPVRGVEVGGNLINPIDGTVIYEGQPQQGHRILTPAEVTTMNLPEGAYQQSPDGKITRIGGTGQNINVDLRTQEALPDGVVSIDEKTGLAVVVDPSSSTGLRQVAIPDGEADVERRAAAAEAEGLESKATEAQRLEALGNTVTMRSIEDSIVALESGETITGPLGGLMSFIPATDSSDHLARLSQITDSAALDEIARMRATSPTGGAVGSLTDGERVALGNAASGISSATSKEKQLEALRHYRDLLVAYSNGEWGVTESGQTVGNMPTSTASATGAPAELEGDDLVNFYLGQN